MRSHGPTAANISTSSARSSAAFFRIHQGEQLTTGTPAARACTPALDAQITIAKQFSRSSDNGRAAGAFCGCGRTRIGRLVTARRRLTISFSQP